ncbi:3'(2'),5'-bisphosphate nucleotidase CysQ [Streptosporangium jomthongense]|uniref:3'(2'),5'-bisphosphate nucleotidase CysQ n=1 Tax=Marinobacter aromaticivorans TaxID=1494078 RepID=A0ABW2ISC1_9GAMM|nr:3'(2'),5'-bisphosphate nucleotidase CysQ [Marinobacter aromaticivorans]GGE57738.1 3'(2'),5'-bisphosphate nucleotidase CysQ [Streptosporangium jomthongense]
MYYSSILPKVIKVADEASEKVLHIYQSDFKVSYKEDESPITAADVASHEIIVKGLRNISPDIPILSEEGAQAPWEERKHWRRFWLIDPIDGTRDFTQRTGEFTVNIAMIEDGVPVMGVVTAPALKEAFWGIKGEGAHKRDRTGQVHRIRVAEPKATRRVVASKNHMNDETRNFIRALGPHRTVQAGSSLKFCRIAEGHADLYPRMGPTSEWDTGAAHAVLLAAGGNVYTLDGEPLQYGKEDVLNPYFIAVGNWYF